ncbi:hypothetical protein N0B44_15755 [Roseibacterium beibuensis]|uniref:Uncharacterized protein n=1 Tax=[Roseibacterium] beibuensis TaxID=1193142 RepID=A0ABP9LCV3_9RHOB|nr:hypothetical protein [Roseibacterium beibuensis]MCS6624374.1 hypothetical protein [Roseibacterium beibuensis]
MSTPCQTPGCRGRIANTAHLSLCPDCRRETMREGTAQADAGHRPGIRILQVPFPSSTSELRTAPVSLPAEPWGATA